MSELSPNSDDEEKMDLFYDGIKKTIEKPDDYKSLLKIFAEEFEEEINENNENIDFFFTNAENKEEKLKKDFCSSDLNDINKLKVRINKVNIQLSSKSNQEIIGQKVIEEKVEDEEKEKEEKETKKVQKQENISSPFVLNEIKSKEENEKKRRDYQIIICFE